MGSTEIYSSQVLKGKTPMPHKGSEKKRKDAISSGKNHELWSSAVGSAAVPLTNYDISGKILHLSASDFSSIKKKRERHTNWLTPEA